MKNAARFFLTGGLAVLLSQPVQSMAEDIDLYSSAVSVTRTDLPNVLFILDNAANFSAAAPSCTYDDTGAKPSLDKTAGGIEQCALNNAINALPTASNGAALVNVGIMIYNAKNMGYGCNASGTGGCLARQLTSMTNTAKASLMAFVKGWTNTGANSIKTNNEATAQAMQEAWAYFAGKTGMSGTRYSSPALEGCQKNYVVFIGNAINNSGSPGDASATPGAELTTTVKNNAALTATQQTMLQTPIQIPSGAYGTSAFSCSPNPYTMPAHTDKNNPELYADEWARYMHSVDLQTGAMPAVKNITTYSIGVLSKDCKADYPALLTSMAIKGGGKYFPAVSAVDVRQAITRVLNEVQAVNSVFSAASLPVSVNAQGTYLNQIFMGMFRPDAAGLPRWRGNLKQYQFSYNSTTQRLFLADAPGIAAISAGGTGFLSPDAASFWTCSNSANPQLGVPPYNIAPYSNTSQCSTDPAAGFWANNQNGSGLAWDLPDGDVVEKGGAAQILRLANLTDTYTASPGSSANPRKLYTYCPSGTGCVATLSNTANVFDASNMAITDAMLGTTPPASSTRDTLIKWVRGEDNLGDEPSLCPPGSTPGVGNCPTPAVNIRPSVHGDVLHSRPVVINYGGAAINITATSDSGTTRTATALAGEVAAIGAVGTQAKVTFANGNICNVTVASTTTFTYSTVGCGASGVQAAATSAPNIVVYYGGNDGVFRAVNGNQTNPPSSTFSSPGGELWGFVAPEFFGQLKRQRDNSPVLQMPSTPAGIVPTPQRKDYFADGSTGIYQVIDATGRTTKAYLYLVMRRGGRFIYALDVTDPNNPKVLWKHSNTDSGFSELGQTWSQPKVARIKGYADPVLIFAAGYDAAAQDVEPPATDTMGRGIFVLDAATGALVWKAGYGASASCPNASAACTVPAMKYSIASDVTLLDRNNDGKIDRLYVGDMGGNMWRVDLEPNGGNTPSLWQVEKLAALGCATGVCASGTTPRKIFYPPEVIATKNYDAVFVATGDREHPLYSTVAQSACTVTNRAYLLKDTATGLDGSTLTPLNEANLYDATSVLWNGTASGYYVTFNACEKSVNAPLVTAGKIYFGTNQGQAPQKHVCEEPLGEAVGYKLTPFSGKYIAGEFEGGGLPPSPVSGVVNVFDVVTGKTIQVPFCIGCGGEEEDNNSGTSGCSSESALAGCKPPISVSTKRSRTYWYTKDK